MGPSVRDLVFVTYSHADGAWLKRLKDHLKPLERQGVIAVWDDQRIRTGARWREEIRDALARTKVAVLLMSPDFLASDFIAQQELPRLFGEQELTVVWIPVRPSNVAATEVGNYQAALDPRRTLAEMDEAEADRALVTVTEEIQRAYGGASSHSFVLGRTRWPLALAAIALATAAVLVMRVRLEAEPIVTRLPGATSVATPSTTTVHIEGDVVQNVGVGGNGVIGSQVNIGGQGTEKR